MKRYVKVIPLALPTTATNTAPSSPLPPPPISPSPPSPPTPTSSGPSPSAQPSPPISATSSPSTHASPVQSPQRTSASTSSNSSPPTAQTSSRTPALTLPTFGHSSMSSRLLLLRRSLCGCWWSGRVCSSMSPSIEKRLRMQRRRHSTLARHHVPSKRCTARLSYGTLPYFSGLTRVLAMAARLEAAEVED